jgi:flagellar basal body-associated protein FliL
MDQDFGTPITPAEEQPKSNRTMIIIVVVLVVLCCCCAIVGGGAAFWLWNNGDALLEGLGMRWLPLLM